MNRSLQILIGVACLAIAAYVYFKDGKKQTAEPQKAGDALYEWVDLRKGQAPQIGITKHFFNVIHITNTEKVRIGIKAPNPISVGMSADKIDPSNFKDISIPNLECSEIQVTEYQHECAVPNRDGYLFMRWDSDDQLSGTQTIDFSLEAWQCTANCVPEVR